MADEKPRNLIVLCITEEHAQSKRYLESPEAPAALRGATVQTALPLHRLTRDSVVACIWHERDQPTDPLITKHSRPIAVSKHWTPDTETGGRVHTGGFLDELGSAIVPCTIKHRDDIVRIAYA